MIKRLFIIFLLAFPSVCDAALIVKNGQTSNIIDLPLQDSSSATGAWLTGLTSASTGLSITVKPDNAGGTTYTVGGSTIESITTIGTFAAPTATKARFKETATAGLYELQIADALFATSNARYLTITVSGATNLVPAVSQVQLTAAGMDPLAAAQPANATQWLGTAILTPGTAGTPDVNAKLHGGTSQTGRDIGASVLLSSGTGTGQLDFTSGVLKANEVQKNGVAAQTIGGYEKTIPAISTAELRKAAFDGLAGTTLDSATDYLGVKFFKHPAAAYTGTLVLDGGRQARSTASDALYLDAAGARSLQQSVSFQSVKFSAAATTVGAVLCCDPNTDTSYLFTDNGSVITLYKSIAGSVTSLGTYSSSLAVGGVRKVTGVHTPAGEVIYVDGTSRITASDTAITSPGYVGIYGSGAIGNATGIHMANWCASYPHRVEGKEFWGNGRGDPAGFYEGIRTTTFARYIVNTDADAVTMRVNSTLYGQTGQPAKYTQFEVRINGAHYAYVQCTANGENYLTVALPAPPVIPAPSGTPGGSGTNRVEIVCPCESRISTGSNTVYGTYLDTVQWAGATRAEIVMPNSSLPTLDVYGDSIAAGDDCTNPTGEAWPVLIGNERPTAVEAWGYRSLYEDANTAALRANLVKTLAGYNPTDIWIEIGTNDYGLNLWSAASFGSAYASLLDDLHRACPMARVWCQTPLLRTDQTAANGHGSTLQDYRDQITANCASRFWTSVIDGVDYSSQVTFSSDGLHPTTAGQATIANKVRSTLNFMTTKVAADVITVEGASLPYHRFGLLPVDDAGISVGTVAGVTDQTHFNVTSAGPASALVGARVLFDDSAGNKSARTVTAASGTTTKSITIDSAPDFTIAIGYYAAFGAPVSVSGIMASGIDDIGTASFTDLNEEAVSEDRTWKLKKDTLLGDSTKNLTVGDAPTYALDFAEGMPTNDYITIVGTPALVSGTTGGITFGSTGRDHSKAKLRITGVTAGTYVFRVKVTLHGGATRTGKVTLKVN